MTALSTTVETNEATMAWTDERVEQLRQAWLEGRTASQIASLLGEGLTRNAVIGKVHRLGLAGRVKPAGVGGPALPQESEEGEESACMAPPWHASQAEPPVLEAQESQPPLQVLHAAPPQAQATAAQIVQGATALAIQPQTLTAIEPREIEQHVVIPLSVRVTIVDLRESMCRWPLGDPTSAEFRYCGSPARSGPYCSHHGGLAYQPADSRRRDRERRLALR